MERLKFYQEILQIMNEKEQTVTRYCVYIK